MTNENMTRFPSKPLSLEERESPGLGRKPLVAAPRAFGNGPGRGAQDADISSPGNRSLDDVLASVEKREILAALERAKGQRTLAAQFLRISRSRLYRRMEALGISPEGPQTQSKS